MDLNHTVMGIELGSTRIKAVMLDRNHEVLASGSFSWENSLLNGVWTYSMEEVRTGMQSCFAELRKDLKEKHHTELTTTGALGISGMMHGYLAFDENDRQICEYRTWRNTMTEEAAEKLSRAFAFNIPQRWSIAHLYQAYLNREEHLKELSWMTTLAGYVHYLLCGEKAVGIGEASGMFPIDSDTGDYDETMLARFREETGIDLRTVLPRVLKAGDEGGFLSRQGALLLDPSGTFQPGIRMVPCEGDAGTGMTATNSIRPGTGNVSAGTSDFAMVVTDRKIAVHREIDMVTTPAGKPVAMVHCNNCTSDIDAWIRLMKEAMERFGFHVDNDTLFAGLYQAALEGEDDCGGMISYNYYSGEGITDLNEGRPVLIRRPDAGFTLANFMRNHLYSAMATLKIGMDILADEKVEIERIYGHGGFFKTPGVGQRILSAAINAPVSVMETAGEGGPYGMALLCAYALWRDEGESLEDYLDKKVFNERKAETVMASSGEIEGFEKYMEFYKKCLDIEREAIRLLR